jgi:hypothetical protein
LRLVAVFLVADLRRDAPALAFFLAPAREGAFLAPAATLRAARLAFLAMLRTPLAMPDSRFSDITERRLRLNKPIIRFT